MDKIIFFALIVLKSEIMKTKRWYETIDFFKLTGMTLLWISSWLFMIPHQVDVQSPFFDNVWGAFLKVFGASKPETSNAQQLPDLMSSLAALFLMIILQMRGIFSVTAGNSSSVSSDGSSEKKHNGALVVFFNVISVLVHTLFFTMLVKIFLFPNTGTTASIYEAMKLNFGITIFTACMVMGMLFAVPSLSRLFMVLLFAVSVFKNISVISSIMGLSGFAAALCAVLGFYLEFLAGGFDKNKLLADFAILSGHYENIYASAEFESRKVRETGAKAIKSAAAGAALLSGNPVAAVSISKGARQKKLAENKPENPVVNETNGVTEKKSFLKHAEKLNHDEEVRSSEDISMSGNSELPDGNL